MCRCCRAPSGMFPPGRPRFSNPFLHPFACGVLPDALPFFFCIVVAVHMKSLSPQFLIRHPFAAEIFLRFFVFAPVFSSFVHQAVISLPCRPFFFMTCWLDFAFFPYLVYPPPLLEGTEAHPYAISFLPFRRDVFSRAGILGTGRLFSDMELP